MPGNTILVGAHMACLCSLQLRSASERKDPSPQTWIFSYIHLFFYGLGNGIALDQLLDGNTLAAPQGRCRVVLARLLDVIQHQSVKGAALMQLEQGALRGEFQMAVDIAHHHVAADAILLEKEVRVGIKIAIPFDVALRAKDCVALGGVDILDDQIVVAAGAGAGVVVAHNDGVVAEGAVQTVDTDVLRR